MKYRRRPYIIATVLLITALLLNPLPLAAKSLWQMDKQASARYSKAKQRYVKLRNEYKQVRAVYLKAEGQFRAAKARAGADQDFADNAKDYLLDSAAVALAYLEALKSQVENTPGVSEGAQADILSEIDDDIEWLQRKQSAIENAVSLDDLEEQSNQIRDYWKSSLARAKKMTGRFVLTKVTFFIERLEAVADRLEDQIEAAKDAGVDTSEAETLLDDARAKIEVAVDEAKTAEAAYQSIDPQKEPKTSVQAAQESSKRVHRQLKDAHRDLKQAVKELKSALKSESVAEED